MNLYSQAQVGNGFELVTLKSQDKFSTTSTKQVFFYPFEPIRQYKEGEGEFESVTQYFNLNHYTKTSLVPPPSKFGCIEV